MLKKRLIFILFFQDGYFHLSRNFTLQKVGDASWLIDKFKFKSIGDYIDELVILDVSRNRNNENLSVIKDSVEKVMRGTFVPLSIGGGILNINDAASLFSIGADKIILNTTLIENSNFVRDLISIYGSQAVVGSIDYRRVEDDYFSFINNGSQKSILLNEAILNAQKLGVGEIIINSIDKDGTGMGFDNSIIDSFPELEIPIIISGGAGKPDHFLDALKNSNISAVGTGNLFNFIGDGFERSRVFISDNFELARKV